MTKRNREVARVQSYIPARWGASPDCARYGTIISLSCRGCLVQTTVEALYGKPIFIRFPLPTERLMILRGELIYYLREVGFAMLFNDVEEQESQMLELLVDFYREDSMRSDVTEVSPEVTRQSTAKH